MPSSRREFLAASTLAASTFLRDAPAEKWLAIDGCAIARSHSMVRDRPTPDFFEGMLLGNGDVGLCITVRPDALGLHMGKSDSWDIRVSEDHAAHVLPFAEVCKLWERASEEAKRQGQPEMTYLEEKIPVLRDYAQRVSSSYRQIWPRPWPCGIVWIHWDPNRYQVARQSLDPSNGLFQLSLLANGLPVLVYAFVNSTSGHICVWSDQAIHVRSVAYQAYTDHVAQLPAPEVTSRPGVFSALQRFPARLDAKPSADDRNFALYGILQGGWKADSVEPGVLQPDRPQALRLDITLITPRDHPDNVAFAAAEASRLSALTPDAIRRSSDSYWTDFWSRSAVQLEDKELERWWYHNQYWLACCLRSGKLAPGLFGNWTSGHIGTAWHGDYHMNYNTQQVFWGVFSSNHAEQHFPYLDLVEALLPLSQKYAREKFDLPGAYFPHSAYPVPSQVVAYPVPPWGYEICETPWVVQSLWWHYLYTQDEAILRRVYPLLKAATEFIAAYVRRGSDGRYHVKPTVSPENWGCTVDYRLNQDCIMDLALIDFLLEATVTASEMLESDAAERAKWSEIRSHLAAYPTAPSGKVWLDVPHAPEGWIYNVPVTLAPVFPGERIGLHSNENDLSLARRTAQTVQLEGGNDIVYQPLIRARLGMLDLDWFKREVRYCLMPNGIVNDRARQTGGRYRDSTDFDFMMRMGVWTENLSLPAVLNECFLQSYNGILRFFPNTRNLGRAQFHHLRAAGAFLVSAAWDGESVSSISVLSERGKTVRLIPPWPNLQVTTSSQSVAVRRNNETIEFDTRAGAEYRLAPL